MALSFDTHFIRFDLVGLQGPAKVTVLEGEVRVATEPGAEARPVELGDVLESGQELTLGRGSRLIAERVGDGQPREFAFTFDEPEEKRTVLLKDEAEMKRSQGNWWRHQLAGFENLLEQAKRFGFDPDAMPGAGKMAAQHTREQVLQVLDPAAASLLAKEAAERLGVVPLRRMDETLLLASTSWNVRRFMDVIRAVERPISGSEVEPDVFEEVKRCVYGG